MKGEKNRVLKETEEKLQELLKHYGEKDAQRRILLMLALNDDDDDDNDDDDEKTCS